MEERLITNECYARIKAAYIEQEYLLWEFPCRVLPEVELCKDYTLRQFAFRIMDVPVPPEINLLWEYEP